MNKHLCMIWFTAEVLDLKLVNQVSTKVVGNIFIRKINKKEITVTIFLSKNQNKFLKNPKFFILCTRNHFRNTNIYMVSIFIWNWNYVHVGPTINYIKKIILAWIILLEILEYQTSMIYYFLKFYRFELKYYLLM